MNVFVILTVAVAGGIGAGFRLVLDGLINRGRQFRLPVGTIIINVSGSLVLGVVVGAASQPESWLVAVLGTGLMGGYTTFSTASVETVRLARAGRIVAATINGLGMLVISVAAAVGGMLLGGAL